MMVSTVLSESSASRMPLLHLQAVHAPPPPKKTKKAKLEVSAGHVSELDMAHSMQCPWRKLHRLFSIAGYV